MEQQRLGKAALPAALAGVIFALQGCASAPPPPVIAYAPPPPPPMVYPPPPPPAAYSNSPPPDYLAMLEAERKLIQEMEQRAMREARNSPSAIQAYREAQAEWAKAQQRIKDARSGKINFADEMAGANQSGDAGATLKVPCRELGGLATPSDCARYSGLRETLQSGVAAFDPPRKMDMGREYPVKLVIGNEEVKAQVIDTATDAGDVKTVDIKLGSWICAELLATQFKLGGPARQCKERGLSRMLSFDWTVSPRQDGKLKLGVKVESLAEQNGKPLDTIDSRMIAVDVEADAIGRFDMMVSRLTDSVGGLRNLLLAIASALGVLSVVVWRIRTLGQKPDKDALKDLTKS